MPNKRDTITPPLSYTHMLAFFVLLASSTQVMGAIPNKDNYQEKAGFVVIEAEHFAAQHKDGKRRWFVFSKDTPPHGYADNDLPHYMDASGGKYIEILPDTRTNHFEPLVRGENFSNVPGQVAVLSYPVYFDTVGKYYIWARAYSTGSEDNGLHFGINGTWPESGRRLQLCAGKHQWTWSSAQRVNTNHCGTPNTISLNIDKPGIHNIMISMREDGFELDKFILSTDENFVPHGLSHNRTVSKPADFPKKDKLLGIDEYSRIFFAASDFVASQNNLATIHSLEDKQALGFSMAEGENQNAYTYTYTNTYTYMQAKVDRRDAGKRKLTLVALGQTHAYSQYKVLLNDKEIGHFTSKIAAEDLQEQYFYINNLNLKRDDVISIGSMAIIDTDTPSSKDMAIGGLWRAVVLSRER